MVPRKDAGPGSSLGGAGETPQEAAGQVWQRAAALLRSHVLRAECVSAGAGSHQVTESLDATYSMSDAHTPGPLRARTAMTFSSGAF